MNPYHEAEGVTLYHGDMRDVLASLPAEIQLIVTSPPYNVERDYGLEGGDRLPLKEYQAKLRVWLKAMYRILRAGGVLALNLPFDISMRVQPSDKWIYLKGHGEQGNIASLDETMACFPISAWVQMEALRLGFLPRRSITWAKGPQEGEAYATSLAMSNVANPFFRPASERILLMSKGQYTRAGTDGRIHLKERIDWLKDVWWISANDGGRPAHPCPFPLKIPERLILLFTEPGDLVCDPFAGSGTTLIAAQLLGRRAIGVEIVEQWCKLATDRLRQRPLPLGLWQ